MVDVGVNVTCVTICTAAPSIVRNLTANFITDAVSYSSMSGLYAGFLNISWREPLSPNGVITSYNYVVMGPAPLVNVIANTSLSNIMDQVSVELTPAEIYSVSVTASTSAGAGPSSTVNITVPEAGKYSL